jgi:hypothetical protein
MRNVLSLLLLSIVFNLPATTYNWIGGISDWEDPANWSPYGIPGGGDEVVISSGNVHLYSSKSLNRIHIESAATLEIMKPGNLYIYPKGGDFVDIDGNLFNYGYLEVKGSTGVTATYLIENNGDLMNEGIVMLSSAPSSAIFCSSASALINNGTFLIRQVAGFNGLLTEGMVVNKGKMDLFQFDHHGWRMEGTLYNSGQIVMDAIFENGLKNSGEIDNHGVITINCDSTYTLINMQGGELTNYQQGELLFRGAGMINDIPCSFLNYGSLKVHDSENLGIRNYGIFTNFQTGKIEVESFQEEGLQNTLSALFKNQGEIVIRTAPNAISGLHNEATFRNLAHGTLSIAETGAVGIRNLDGIILNKGDLFLTDINGDGIINEGSSIFRNWNGGNLQMQAITGTSLDNYQNASFDNSDAVLKCAADGLRSIYNRNDFHNRRCGEAHCPEQIANRSGADFLNDAFLFTSYQGQHFNQSGGNITNNGVIEDIHAAFDGVQLTNNGVIAAPIADPAYVGQAVNNALGLGSLSNVAINGWWIDEQGNYPAGTYNAGSNTFTPNSNAANRTRLYVEVDLGFDKNCRPRMIELNFLQGIRYYQSMAKNESGAATPTASGIRVYPNPCAEACQVEIIPQASGAGMLSLYSSNGQVVWQRSMYADALTTLPFEPQGLKPGIYWLRWQAEAGGNLAAPLMVVP